MAIDVLAEVRNLGNESVPLSMHHLVALSGLSDSQIAAVWDEWLHISDKRRLTIVKALLLLAEENVDLDFCQMFQGCLDDSTPAIRAVAVEGLWEEESLTILGRMLHLLDDPSSEVREAALLNLGRFAYLAEVGDLPEAYAQRLQTALLQVAEDPDQPLEVVRRAIEGLGYWSASDVVQTLVAQAYQHTDQRMRESALVAMGRSMNPAWFPYLRRELESALPSLRYEAARAVGELGEDGQPLLPGLLPLVQDSDNEVAQSAIWALGQVGGNRARQVLQKVASGANSARAEAAQEALAELHFFEEDAL